MMASRSDSYMDRTNHNPDYDTGDKHTPRPSQAPGNLSPVEEEREEDFVFVVSVEGIDPFEWVAPSYVASVLGPLCLAWGVLCRCLE